MSAVWKLLVVLFVLIIAFFVGYTIGFTYITDDPSEAFQLETWRTFIQQLKSF